MTNYYEIELRAPVGKKHIQNVQNTTKYVSSSIEHDVYFRFKSKPQPSWIVRIRTSGRAHFLTYKSSNKGEGSWSEVDIPISKATAQKLRSFYPENGFLLDVIIEKKRKTFSHDSMTINIDELAGVGTYIEAEIIATEKEIQKAKEKIRAFFLSIGIGRKTITEKGYVSIFKEEKGGK